jgi:hypothetical protein
MQSLLQGNSHVYDFSEKPIPYNGISKQALGFHYIVLIIQDLPKLSTCLLL